MPGPPNVPNGTLLLITPLSGNTGLTLTPYSARGLTQTLKPLNDPRWTQRDINANLINLSDPRFRKYISEITCHDAETPTLDDAWIGEVCLVQCACFLSFPTGGTPQRPVVSGSEFTEGSFTFYQPELTMMVTDIDPAFTEYQAEWNWRIKLAEV